MRVNGQFSHLALLVSSICFSLKVSEAYQLRRTDFRADVLILLIIFFKDNRASKSLQAFVGHESHIE